MWEVSSNTFACQVGGDGVIPGTKKRPVLLGALTGKLSEGTGQIQGFREDRRNVVKPVKPLYYGAFGSYAPSYDSAFSNLSKEESDLIYQTYGSETAVQYAESIVDFAKDNDYTVWIVDSLLDLLTGNEHSRTKKVGSYLYIYLCTFITYIYYRYWMSISDFERKKMQ